MFENWRYHIDLALKALTVSLIVTLIIELFGIVGLFKTPTVLLAGLETILLPVFIIALLASLLAERKLSNNMGQHLPANILGPVLLSVEILIIAWFGTFSFINTFLGTVLIFWIGFFTLFLLYIKTVRY